MFSLSKQQPKVKLQINSQPIRADDSPTYLGVTLDRRPTLKNQMHKNQARAKINTTVMRMLAGTCWGADQRVLKKLCVGRICPVLEYGMTSTCTAAKSNTEKNNRVHNQDMSMMAGAMGSSPISALETATGLQYLEDRNVSIKVLTRQQNSEDSQTTPCTAEWANQQKEGWRGSALSIIAGSLRDSSLDCWTTFQNPSKPLQLSPAGKGRISQPSLCASKVSTEKQPSQTLREDPLPWGVDTGLHWLICHWSYHGWR